MQYEKKAGHHVGTKYTMGIVLKNSIMKKRTGEVRLPSDNKAKK